MPPTLTDGARAQAIPRERVQQAAGLLGPDGMPLAPAGADAWMGPGRPVRPVAPPDDVAGRAFDYPQTWNLNTTPRSFARITFPVLRALSESFDLLRLAIETRKDQMSELSFSIQPRKKARNQFRPPTDERSDIAEQFFRKPDGEHYWDQWIRMLADQQMVEDAATIYRRRNRGGELHAVEIMDGATILPLLDHTGRTPIAPDPAFQQILKGLPAKNYTTDELIYAPRNPRAHTRYGLSPTEQVLITVNIGLRRMLGQLHHYTEGNVPEALVGLPETWTLEQIAAFQKYWDSLLADPTQRRRARFVPGQFAFQPTRTDGQLMDQFDEWLARVICYAFSLPPLPFVKMMNRSTAETSYDAALREGLAPMMTWAKNIHDDILARWFGWPDLELVWDDIRQLDPTEQLGVDMQEMRAGIRGLDDLRASRGLDAVGLGPIVYGVGPLGFMTPDQMRQCIVQGLTMPQAPPPPDMMGMGMPPGGAEEDPLAGAPPELLAQLGAAPAADSGEGDPGFDEELDPASAPMSAPSGSPSPLSALAPAVARRLGGQNPRAFVARLLGRATKRLDQNPRKARG